MVVLAVLTSLPNAYTAVRLGLVGRGSALVSETLASNTINLVGGVIIPALAVGVAARSGLVDFDLALENGDGRSGQKNRRRRIHVGALPLHRQTAAARVHLHRRR